MAFTGTAVFEQISDSIVRVTGLSLAAGASGTIGLSTRTTPGEKSLPAGFKPQPAKYDGHAVGLIAAIDVTVKPNGTGGILVAVPVNVVKTGDTPQTWLVTLTNPTSGPGSATNGLEIFVKFHE